MITLEPTVLGLDTPVYIVTLIDENGRFDEPVRVFRSLSKSLEFVNNMSDHFDLEDDWFQEEITDILSVYYPTKRSIPGYTGVVIIETVM